MMSKGYLLTGFGQSSLVITLESRQSFCWALLLVALPIVAHADSEQLNTEPRVKIPLLAFNTGFLQGGSAQPADVLALLQGGSNVLPGNYRVEIYVNGDLNGRRDIEFKQEAAGAEVQPCLTPVMFKDFGIDLLKLQNPELLAPENANRCYPLDTLIEQAEVKFDSARLHLLISVPQAFMQAGVRGYVDPALWDEGVTAAFINYQFNMRRNSSGGTRSTSKYLGLQNGFNLGSWRLRNESNLTMNEGQPTKFSSNRSFVQRDITALKAQLALGEIYTNGNIFDSVRFRGAQLTSDDAMLADSERGYAPIIRGVAETNATVEVRQNGYVIYSTPVSAGAFELTDIYPSGSNGDLEVTVVEADGRRRVTRQAFSSLPVMVRKGRMTFSVAGGQYQSNDNSQQSPSFVSTALAYGLSDDMTGTFGLQVAENFQALNFGIGRNTPIGALSVDITQSASKIPQQTDKGQSIRVLYAKTFAQTSTDFTLAAYRYSTEGYRSFSDHVQDLNRDLTSTRMGRSRARLDLTVQQSLGEKQQYGSIYLSASDQSYWNSSTRSQSISAGYGNYWKSLNYSVSLTHTRNIAERGSASSNDSQVALSFSLPLGSTAHSPRATLRILRDREGNQNTQAGLNGYLGPATNYSFQGGRDGQGGNSGNASISTDTAVGRMDLGYGQGPDYKSLNVGASGSVVAHAGGINLGQQVGESFVLAEVPDTPGVGIISNAGVTTGRNGFAIVPNAQPYRLNWVSLDTGNLGADIELEQATQQVVPRRGAVVLARYQAQIGRRVQFILRHADGKKMGFGATVEDPEGKQSAISDPYGMALMLLKQDKGLMNVTWDGSTCQAPYDLPERNKELNYEQAELKCKGN